MRKPRLAKLTRPRLARALPRERLFVRLDEARAERRAVFAIGPPGAGKTTVVASWLDARSIRGIWFQVDAGDADLATFFHYLSQAAAAYTRKQQRPLPALTPEYLHDVRGFARRFFRELFARLPKRGVLVLDNYHEVPSNLLFHEVVADALDELPSGTTVIAISRHDPPQSFARSIASEQVDSIGWTELKLTLPEAHAIGRLRGVDVSLLEGLHVRSDGWAAGLTLLMERARQEPSYAHIDSPESLREVFNYFAGQLFDRAPPIVRSLLLELSFLPRMSASSVRQLTASDRAIDVLEDLHRRNLFTDRRLTHEVVYQFHALFKAFLEHRANQVLSSAEHTALLFRAAQVLDEGGEPEEAMPLYLRADDYDDAQALILRESGRLIDQGRWQIVLTWIEALPYERVRGESWLLLWLGVARSCVAPVDARRWLEASFALARDTGDLICELEAVAALVQTYIFEYASFWPLDRWIDAMQDGISRRPRFGDDESELRVQSALLIALAYRRPASAALAPCVQRLFELVQGDAPANLRLTGLAYLLAYSTTTGPLALAERALPLLEALLEHREVRALNVAWSSFIIAHCNIIRGKPHEVRRAGARIEWVADEHGLPFVGSFSNIIQCWHECQLGDLGAAENFLARLEAHLDPSRTYDVASLHTLRMLLAYLSGDGERALQEGAKAVALFDATGSVMHRMLSRDVMASTALQLGKIADARQLLTTLREVAAGSRPTWMEGRIRVHEALAMLDSGEREEGLKALREGLAFTREHRTGAQLKYARPLLPRIAAHAVEAGIEVSFVREMIRSLELRAPTGAHDAWPWPIKVYTLGQFRVLIDERALVFSHKVPRKPFALLKAIIAMGGHDVRTERLMDALWPQEPGDSAHEAFQQALFRLRKLLCTPNIVQLADGRVSLDEAQLWTDVRAFEEGLVDASRTERALQLYRGDFLADEVDQPWAASTRERLRAKFLHQVARQATELEAEQRWDDAIALYLRGMDADVLSESFYQGLMRCYAARGMRAEALSVYRRLRQQLSVTLGLAPSPSSEALLRELRLR